MLRKGFTLVELMIVILIVAILAAVAIPLMTGRIDAAKWSEGKAAMGTIATAVRAFYAEKGVNTTLSPSLTSSDAGFVGVTPSDLEGTYFTATCYALSNCSVTTGGQVSFTVTCTAATGGKSGYPTNPAAETLTCNAANNYQPTFAP